MRGRPVSMYGTADLQERKADGTRVQAARPDQMIYLDCPAAPPQVIVVGQFPLPDVVFEVDLTTDVRGPQARGVRVVGGTRAVGGGSRREHAEQAQAAGADRPRPEGRGVPAARGERRVPTLSAEELHGR